VAYSLTQNLGEFIAGLRFESIPADALPVIKMGFTDCIGVMMAGSGEAVVGLLIATLAPPPGDSRLLLGRRTAPAPLAAWINGASAHALDYDDVALRGHPSAVLVPAILAEAQAIGASGADMVAAYAAGYETWAELARRDADHYHEKGWHPTGVFGAVGAAAACANLLKLSAHHCAQAIALAGSQSSGLMANFGTMTKPFHAGRAAHAGVLSARLVKGGFTASGDALEHPQGFLSALSPRGRIDKDTAIEAGTSWKLLTAKLGIKKYPLCYCTHRALDAIHDLVKETPIAATSVKRVVVHTSRHNATILRNHLPQTGLEAKFSMEFAMASVLVFGRAGLSELQDDFVRRREVQSLMGRVVVEADCEEDPATPGKLPFDLVAVETNEGRVQLSRKVKDIRGGPELPLSREELWGKFSDCLRVSGGLPARDLFDRLMELDTLSNANDLPYSSQ